MNIYRNSFRTFSNTFVWAAIWFLLYEVHGSSKTFYFRQNLFTFEKNFLQKLEALSRGVL